MVIFNSYVKLPEGIYIIFQNFYMNHLGLSEKGLRKGY